MTSPAVLQLVQAANAGSNPHLSQDERRQAVAVLLCSSSRPGELACWGAGMNRWVWGVTVRNTIHRQAGTRCLQVVEQAKAGSPEICVQAFFHLFQSSGDTGSQLNGLTLLRHVLRNRWDALSPEQQQELEQHITSIAVSPETSKHASPIRMQLAYAISDVAVQAGDTSADSVLKTTIPQLVQHSTSLRPPSTG